MATPNIVPRADSEGGLGTASKYWGSAYIDAIYVGAGFVGRDADNRVDFAVDNIISFKANGANRLHVGSNQVYPETNNALSLGYATREFSDLFLGDGAVINFNNGNVVLTHSNNTLTLADNDILGFGNASDLSIKHTDAAGYIQNVKGHLYINQIADGKDIIFQSDDGSGSYVPYLTLDGGVVKTTVHKPLKFDDGISAEYGTDTDMIMYHSGSAGYIEHYTGNLNIIQHENNADIVIQCDDGSGGVTTYIRIDGSATQTKFEKSVRLPDSIRAEFGSSGDFVIMHDSSDSKIENATGDLKIRNFSNDRDIIFENDNGAGGSTTYFYLDGSSATHDGSATTNLYTNWPDKSNISFGTGHDMNIKHDGSDSYIQNHTGNLVIRQNADGADTIFQCDDGSGSITSYLTLDGSATRVHLPAINLEFADSVKAKFGDSGDMEIYHDGSTSAFIHNKIGDLYIKNDEAAHDIYFQCDDGSGGLANYLILDGGEVKTIFSKPIEVGADDAGHDVTFYGATSGKNMLWDESADRLIFSDNTYLALGTGGADYLIFHTGSNGYLSNYTGDLYITNSADNKDIIFQCDDHEGGTETYFFLDGSRNTSGDQSPYTVFPDGATLALGSDADLRLKHTGSNGELTNTTGNFNFYQNTDGGDIRFYNDNGSGGTTEYLRLDGTNVRTLVKKNLNIEDNVQVQIGNSQDLKLYHNTSHSYISQEGAGNLYIQSLVDDGDVIFLASTGSAAPETYFWLDGSVGRVLYNKTTRHLDGVYAQFGTSGDLNIYHDGSNSHISDTGTGDLIITADNDLTFKDGSGNTMANMNASDSVELYFGNSKKFETAAGGIEVAGTIAGSSFRGVRKVVNSTTSNVASALSGQIYSFDDADGATVTLPDSGAGSYTGTTFEFVIKTTATSNSHKIILSDTTNEKFIGAVATIDTDNDNAATFYTPATSNKAITMNGTTTGITGSRIRITNIAADIWSVEGTILHTGNTATPFTNS